MPTKVHRVKAMVFPVVMYEGKSCIIRESWVLKNWCFWTVVLKKTLESPLDCKEIQPVHPKGDQSWVFIVRTDVEAETPILWPPDANSWLIGKVPNAGKDWGQAEKERTEDEMAGWHHFDGHEFEWTLRVGDGQGGLECCDSWSRKESDTTEWLKLNRLSNITNVRGKKVKSLSCVWLFMTPWTVPLQAPLSMGFSRQEIWNGLSCPPPGELPNPEIEPRSHALQADALLSEPLGKL